MSRAATVVMVSPDQFGFNPQTAETNPFQRILEASELEIRNKALKEFNEMVKKLEEEKIKVLVLGSRVDVSTPDAVFPNNWFTHHSDGRLVVYPMMAQNRRLERQPHNLKNLLNDAKINHIKIIDMTADEKTGRILEGTGSMVLDRDNRVAFAMESTRTNKQEFEKWCREMDYEGVFFHGFDDKAKPIYHTNIAMGLGEKFAVICFDVVSSVKEKYMVETKLKNLGKEIISITIPQMNDYCANIIELRSSDNKSKIIMSKTAWHAFTPAQRTTLAKYGEPVVVDIPTIETAGGGSARCMIAEIY